MDFYRFLLISPWMPFIYMTYKFPFMLLLGCPLFFMAYETSYYTQ